jgi:hypothetical protein
MNYRRREDKTIQFKEKYDQFLGALQKKYHNNGKCAEEEFHNSKYDKHNAAKSACPCEDLQEQIRVR